jgi:hypothetical protein
LAGLVLIRIFFGGFAILATCLLNLLFVLFTAERKPIELIKSICDGFGEVIPDVLRSNYFLRASALGDLELSVIPEIYELT